MNKKMTILLFTALTAFIAQFTPIYVLYSDMNPFLISTIRFVLLTTVIFLIFEKRILVNFKAVLKDGLMMGTLAGLSLILSVAGTGMTGPLSGLFFFILPAAMYVSRKPLITILVALPAFAFICIASFNIAGIILLLISALLEYAAIYYFFRRFRSEGMMREVLFIATLLPALFSTAAFFITKPANAAILSDIQKFSLLMLIIPSTLIPAAFAVAGKKLFTGTRPWLIPVFAGLAGLLVNFPYVGIWNAAAIVLLSLSSVNFRPVRKGTGRVEMIAVATLAAIVIALIMPVRDSVRARMTIYNDNQDFKNGKPVSETVSIGNILVKLENGKPAYVYQTGSGMFISVPIR